MTRQTRLSSLVRFAAIMISAGIAFSLISDNANAQSCSKGPGWKDGGSCSKGPGWNDGGYVKLPQPRCCQPKLGFIGKINCHGMEVLEVSRFSTAAEIGLEPGDIILKVNGQKVTSHDRFQHLLYDALEGHGGHAELLVKKPYGYQNIVKLCVHLEHSCHQSIGVGH